MTNDERVKKLACAIYDWTQIQWIAPASHEDFARTLLSTLVPDWQFAETGEAKPAPGSLVDASMEDPAVKTVAYARTMLNEADRGAFYYKATIVTLCREVERLLREKAWAEAELATARERNADLENELEDAKAAHATAILGQRAAHEEALLHIRCALDARNNESALDAAKRTARELADTKAEADAIRKARVSEWPITSKILGKSTKEFVEDAAARVVRERDDARWMAEEAWRWVEMARKAWTDAKEVLEELAIDFQELNAVLERRRVEIVRMMSERDDAKRYVAALAKLFAAKESALADGEKGGAE